MVLVIDLEELKIHILGDQVCDLKKYTENWQLEQIRETDKIRYFYDLQKHTVKLLLLDTSNFNVKFIIS